MTDAVTDAVTDDERADARIRRLEPFLLPALRESAGRHHLDGQVPDLHPDAVTAALAEVGGDPLDDPHDEAHLRSFEDLVRVLYGEVAVHRRSARPLLAALDLAVYDKPYAPEADRQAARAHHLAAWPTLIDGGIAALDDVPATLATGLLRSVRGAAADLDPAEEGAAEALAAHGRLVGHLEHAAEHGDPDPALGGPALTRLLAAGDAIEVDLGRLEAQADTERDRLAGVLREAVRGLDADRDVPTMVSGLLDDHPDADGVVTTARELTAEVIAFVREAGLLDDADTEGECRVQPSPPSRRWATAMLSWAAPYEPDGPSFYSITPPDPTWTPQRQRQWLSAFSHTTLPSTTVHEVAPGHFSHGRALRRARGPVRRSLQSSAFVEGWAHYAEELLVEEGYRADDPRFAAGVALKALLRVTRMAVAIGLHRRTMDVAEAAERFRRDALLRDAVAEAEVARATFDPTYGRYTWGKLELLRLRDEARRQWGAGFTSRRFHRSVLALGAPPLGLLGAALAPGHEGDDGDGVAGGSDVR